MTKMVEPSSLLYGTPSGHVGIPELSAAVCQTTDSLIRMLDVYNPLSSLTSPPAKDEMFEEQEAKVDRGHPSNT